MIFAFVLLGVMLVVPVVVSVVPGCAPARKYWREYRIRANEMRAIKMENRLFSAALNLAPENTPEIMELLDRHIQGGVKGGLKAGLQKIVLNAVKEIPDGSPLGLKQGDMDKIQELKSDQKAPAQDLNTEDARNFVTVR